MKFSRLQHYLYQFVQNVYYMPRDMEILLDRKLVTRKFEQIAFEAKSIGVTSELHCDRNIIVSLTTYSKRIFDVYLAIESILHQTVKPNKILLWLSKDEFTLSELPVSLKRQLDRGLEIGFCEDIRSYKKLIPTLKKHDSDIIITIDDDVIYPYDFVERMLKQYKIDPNGVCYYRGRKMKLDKSGELLPYKEWKVDGEDVNASLLNFPTGVGGVLYPPHCFHEDILCADLFMKLAPSADDIWFKAMTTAKGIMCKRLFIERDFDAKFISLGMQDIALYNKNILLNDKQVENVFNKYDLHNLIKVNAISQ